MSQKDLLSAEENVQRMLQYPAKKRDSVDSNQNRPISGVQKKPPRYSRDFSPSLRSKQVVFEEDKPNNNLIQSCQK